MKRYFGKHHVLPKDHSQINSSWNILNSQLQPRKQKECMPSVLLYTYMEKLRQGPGEQMERYGSIYKVRL